MKCFKTISTSFIIVIAIILACNVFYLISLHNSIRSNVERDVMTAIADADLDELWVRAERAQAGKRMTRRTANHMERPLSIKIPTEIWWQQRVIWMAP